MTILVTIEGAKQAPSWEALQTLLTTALYSPDLSAAADDEGAKMVRIARADGGSNYRGFGIYGITLRDGTEISLKVCP